MIRPALLLAAAALSLGACGNSKELAGRGYMPPSEVTVTRTVPLTVPPGFGLRPEDTAGQQGAGGTVIASAAEPATLDIAMLDATPVEQELMVRAGVLDANANIRHVLNRENALLADDPALVDLLLFGSFPKAVTGEGTTQQAPGVVIEEGGDVAPDVAIEQGAPVEDGTWVDSIIDLF